MKSIRSVLAGVLWRAAARLTAPPTEANPEWVQVKAGPVKGAQLYLDVRDGSSREMADGVYDDFIRQALDELGLIRPGIAVWDIGAFVGYYSLLFAALVGPQGQVVAFEPNPYNVALFRQQLQRNQSLGRCIELKTLAISDTIGQQMFRFSPAFLEGTLGFLDEVGRPSDRISPAVYKKFQTIPVQVSTLDAVLRDGTVPPALIKVDVEGAEVHVLKGAHHLLETYKPAILLEVHNIQCMFYVQEILLNHKYQTEFLVNPKGQSSSRGFILAC